MLKNKITACIFIALFGMSIFTLASCNQEQPTKSITTTSTHPTSRVITPTSATPTSIPSPKPIPNTSSPAIALPFTADFTVVHNYRNTAKDRYAVIVYNNTNVYQKFSCTVRQRDTKGNFLSDYTLNTNYVSPKSHLISTLPDGMTSDLSINNPHILAIPANQTPQFVNVIISNIQIQTAKDQNKKDVIVLSGTLLNVGNVNPNGAFEASNLTPKSINLQIMTRRSDGNFNLAYGGLPLSSETYAMNVSGFQGSTGYGTYTTQCIMPPPKEKVQFFVPLWQSITIMDAEHATINGEITIVASSDYQ